MVTYSNQDVHQQEQRINQEEYMFFVDICKDTGFNIQNCYFGAAHVDEHWVFSMPCNSLDDENSISLL